MKHTLTFCAGVASFAGVTYAAGFHGTTLCFTFGILTAAAALVAALSSKARLRAAARFLNALAGADAPAAPRKMRRTVRSSRTRRGVPELNGIAADVASALQNFGARPRAAAMAAQAAADELPGGTFEDMFRIALPLSKPAQTA